MAPVARKADVPVIAFSNDRQVAGSGVYLLSFQPAPEVERVVAYRRQQGKRRFAALIPQDAFGKIVEPAFRNAVSRAGGTIVALEDLSWVGQLRCSSRCARSAPLITAAEAEGAPVDALFLPGGQEHLESLGRLLPQAQIDTQQVQADRHGRHGLSQRRPRRARWSAHGIRGPIRAAGPTSRRSSPRATGRRRPASPASPTMR